VNSINKLTIILPLFGRENYTQNWLSDNYYKYVNYLVADGGKNDNNQLIFNDIKRTNIKYIRYPVDKDCKTFVKKIFDVSKYIKTPYVFLADNDDILNIKNIFDCIKYLEFNRSYQLASGKIAYIKYYKIDTYSLTPYLHSSRELSNLNFKESIKVYLSPTLKNNKYLWYSVYRTEIFQKVWENMFKAEIDDWHLLERSQTVFTLFEGKFKFINNIHYIRRVIKGSSHAENIAKSSNHFDIKIFKDKIFYKKLMNFSKYVESKFKYQNFHTDYIYFAKNFKSKVGFIYYMKLIILRVFKMRLKYILNLINILY
tara:strand:- start:3188 stop:4126 length:939 start_codon:yes stop_codon:yes gene_type:complete